jgi:hypothetical protein
MSPSFRLQPTEFDRNAMFRYKTAMASDFGRDSAQLAD